MCKAMTNAEKIREMSDNDLANFIVAVAYENEKTHSHNLRSKWDSFFKVKEWLRSEAKSNQ